MPKEAVERLFSTPAPARLKLSNISGSVKISGHHADTIGVRALIQPHSGDAEGTEIELNQDDDGKVFVTTRYLNNQSLFPERHKPCDVDYVLKVPTACKLEVSAVSNWSEIENISGEAVITTVSGLVYVKALLGHIQIDSVSAKIRGEFLSGPLHIKCVSGGVFLRNSVIPSAHISTVSGNINIQASLSKGPYRFESISGDLILAIQPGTGCLVRFHTLSGGFKTNLSIDHERKQPGQRELTLQGGGPEVRYQSISGNLRLSHIDRANKIIDGAFSGTTMPNPGVDEVFSQEIRDYT